MVPARPGLRSLAFAIDAAIVLLLTLPMTLGTLPLWMGALASVNPADPLSLLADDGFVWGAIFYGIGQLLLMIFLLVQLILHGRRGITVGKAIVGLRSVNVVRFTKPGFWRMFMRGVIFWASLTIVPILGAVPFLLSPLWDPQKRGRGWLDRVGGNWLIDARRGLDPFDTKAMRHARRRLEKPEVEAEQRMPSLATTTSGAVVDFVPAGRSRSGVVAPGGYDNAAEAWVPPPIAEMPAAAPAQPAHQPRPPAQQAAAASPAKPGAIFEFDDGAKLRVSGSGLLGRAPQIPQGEAFDHAIPVADETLMISKTHAQFEVDDSGCWFTDRGSVNGVEVVKPGGSTGDLVPWERSLIPWGSTVTLGGRTLTLVPDPQSNGGNR
ncbi:hypothetical protein C2138_11140 [Salinibacterium hongtaonis]|nr:hypothetical protein C2138_11140 [Salinibacterium hongtaonis]